MIGLARRHLVAQGAGQGPSSRPASALSRGLPRSSRRARRGTSRRPTRQRHRRLAGAGHADRRAPTIGDQCASSRMSSRAQACSGLPRPGEPLAGEKLRVLTRHCAGSPHAVVFRLSDAPVRPCRCRRYASLAALVHEQTPRTSVNSASSEIRQALFHVRRRDSMPARCRSAGRCGCGRVELVGRGDGTVAVVVLGRDARAQALQRIAASRVTTTTCASGMRGLLRAREQDDRVVHAGGLARSPSHAGALSSSPRSKITRPLPGSAIPQPVGVVSACS